LVILIYVLIVIDYYSNCFFDIDQKTKQVKNKLDIQHNLISSNENKFKKVEGRVQKRA